MNTNQTLTERDPDVGRPSYRPSTSPKTASV